MADQNYAIETKSTATQNQGKEELLACFRASPVPADHLLVNMGLYMRSSALAKLLFLDEIYRRILPVPGIICEFGTWWGQNLAVFENLRAIHEPFNQTRRVIGFDTFKGYPTPSAKDRPADTTGFNFASAVVEGGYSVSQNYRDHLDRVLSAQQQCNILGNIKKHALVEGDVTKTAPEYFGSQPGIVVALAYFDMALYEPTKVCLQAIKPRLVAGSVILLDEFNFPEAPGETIAFREAFADVEW